MTEFKVDALVIRSVDYRDYDKMLTLFSSTHGKLSAISRGSRKPNSKVRASTEYFAYSEFIVREKSGRLSVTQASLKESFYDIRSKYKAFNVAFAILESLNVVLQENQESHELFDIAYTLLSFLAYSELNSDDLWILYLVKVLKNQGLQPSTVKCSLCDKSTFLCPAFSSRYGTICKECSTKHSSTQIAPLTVETLRRLLALNLSNTAKVAIPIAQQEELLLILLKYYHEHVGGKYRSALLKIQQ